MSTTNESLFDKLENFYDDEVNMNVYKNMFYLKKDPFNDYEPVKN